MAASSEAATTTSLPISPTPRSRHAFLLILVWVATVAALSALPGAALHRALADLGTSELVLVLVSSAIGASAAICAHVTARLAGDRRWSWAASSLWLYAFVFLPSEATVAPPGPAGATVNRLAGLMLVGVAVVLSVRRSWTPGRRTGIVTAGAGFAALGAVDLAARHVPAFAAPAARLMDSSAVDVLFVLTALLVAAVCVHSGLRSGSLAMVAAGVGAGTIVLAEVRQAFADVAPPSPLIRLLGLLLVLLGLLTVASDARQRVERRLAGLEAELAGATAAQHLWQRRAAERDHELRNGLTGLAGLPDLLDRPPPPPDRAPLRRAVESELGRLAAILDGAERDTGGYRLATLVDDTVALHAPPSTAVDVPEDLWVAGRRSVGGQILTNLLINCARHAPGAVVQVRSRRDGDRVLLEVRDGGPTACARATSAGRGPGLGLGICRQMAEAEGGTLRIEEPDPGAGRLVVVALPAARP